MARKTNECLFGKVQAILIVLMIIRLDVSNAEKITGVNNKSITIECNNENSTIILMPNGDLCSDGDSTTLPCGHQLDRTLLEECNLKRRCEPVLSNVPMGKTMEITYYCVLASRVYDICQLATITTDLGGFYLKSEDYPKGGTTQSCSCMAKSIDSIPIRVTFRDMFFTTSAICDKREYLEITTTNDAQPPNVVQNCKNMDINKAIYQLGGKATNVTIKYTRKNGPAKIDPGRFLIQIFGPAALKWSCKKDSSTTIVPPLIPLTTTKTGSISPTSFKNPTTDLDNVATVGNLSEGVTMSTSKSTDFIHSSTVDVITEAAATAAVDVTTVTAATTAVDVTTETAATAAVDVTPKTAATAAVDVTTKTAENGDSGALMGGIIAGIVLFVLLNVAIAIALGQIKRRRATSKAKRENYSSTSNTDEPYDDIALGPNGALRTPNQEHPYDNAAFNRSDVDEYSEISGITSQGYSLQLPNPDSRSVSSGERTPEYHVLEPDGPKSPVYFELESDIKNRFNFKKNAGDEIYTSLQPTGSGTQTPVYQSLHADNTSSSVFYPTIATEPEHKLENTVVDPVPDVKIVDGAPNQEEYSLVGNAQGPKQAQGDHRALPLISVNDAGVDSCDSSLPISYDYVCDIETIKAREKGSHSEFKPLDNGDVYLELVADDQPCKDNASQGSYDYVHDVDKMPKSSKPGQGEKSLKVSRDQNSDERHKDGNLETDDINDPDYLELVADADHTNDGYLRPNASNQEDNHSSAEYDYTYSSRDQPVVASGGQKNN